MKMLIAFWNSNVTCDFVHVINRVIQSNFLSYFSLSFRVPTIDIVQLFFFFVALWFFFIFIGYTIFEELSPEEKEIEEKEIEEKEEKEIEEREELKK